MALAPGTRFGSYEVVERIGSGGMGEVWRATDTSLKRDVALKVLPQAFVEDSDRLARFQREAEALASLNHSNIAQIYGLEIGDGHKVIVMEIVQGPTLADRIAAGPVSPDQAIDIATQITDALEAAHEQGIVHRDLKPANIKLRPNGTVAVLDFGLAKTAEPAMGSEGAASPALTSPALTAMGTILGTAAYMSPEQARGKPVDKRADIWAFGCVLYEMLTGQPPFLGEDVADTVAAVLKTDPDWRALPELPPIIEAFLKQCLQKNPDSRVHDIADVRLALVGAYQFRRETATVDTGSRGRAPFRFGWPVAAFLGLALGAAGVTYWVAGPAGDASAMSVRQLTFRHGNVGTGRFAPDGQVVVYGAAWDEEPYQLYTTRLDSYLSRPLDLAADLLALSQDSIMALAMDRQAGEGWLPHGALAEAPLAGGAPRVIDDGVVAVDYGPDGELAAIVRRRDDRSYLEFPAGTVVHEAGVIGFPRVSRDGTRVCFQSDWERLMLSELDGPTTEIVSNVPRVNTCAWSPDDSEVWFTYSPTGSTHENLEAVSMDGDVRRVLAPFPAFAHLQDISADGAALLGVGQIRYAVRGSASLSDRELDLSIFDATTVEYLNPAGTQILLGDDSTGARAMGATLFLRSLDGSPPIEIGNATALALTPDGTQVAVLGDGDSRVYQSSSIALIPTGAGSPRTIRLPIEVQSRDRSPMGINSWDVKYPEFSDDGRRLLLPFGRDDSGVARAYVHDLADGWTRAVTPEGVTGPVVLSPDGRFVASNEPDGLFVYSVDSGERRQVPGGPYPGMPARWSSDPDVIYLVESGVASATLIARNLQTGERTPVREFRAPDSAGATRFDLYVARDGEAYAYSLDHWLTNLFLLETVD